MVAVLSTIPTNSTTVYIAGAISSNNTYSTLVGLGTYSVLSGFSYGGLQNTQSTSTALVVIPTNSTTVVLSN